MCCAICFSEILHLNVRSQETGVRSQKEENQTTGSWLLTSDFSMYSQNVLDHFHHPRNVGEIAEATAVVEMTNPVCGDLMKLWVVAREGKILDAKFKAEGCIPAVACGSWLAEAIVGKSIQDLASITAMQIEAALGGLPPASRHASALAADALKRVLQALQG